jgi:hypothetical protein
MRLKKGLIDVHFGSKADMCSAQADVRFTPESGHGPASLDHLVSTADYRKGDSEAKRLSCLEV